MNYTDKSKEELIIELQELQKKHLLLEELYEKDMAGLKQIEAVLQKSEKKNRHIVENAPIGIFQRELDGEGEYIYCNPTHAKHFECETIEEFVRNYGEISKRWFYPEKHEEFKALIRKNKVVYDFEVKSQLKNGTIKWFSLSAFLEDSNLINGFALDITAVKITQEALIRAKEKAEESDKLKSAFLANMSHEIRTPMNGILGFSALLSNPDLESEKQKEYIKIIQRSGARMLNIISEIVDISKIESGQMGVHLVKTNINEKIESVYNLLKPDAENKRINLSFKSSLPAEEAFIITDHEKLFSILTNLVKNSIKYTDKGTIEFGCNIVESLHSTSQLQFYVKDTGIGIPKNRQEAIFERFIQADIADLEARQGAGLGLSIAKAYVEMLGGKIWVESEQGKGSTFYFTLPYHIESEEKKPAKNMDSVDGKESRIKMLNILIVEDDEASGIFLTTILNNNNKILHAQSGNEAVNLCRNNPDIDLILMDIKMSDLNGYEATRQIRQFNKNVVVIAQTAFGLAGDKEKAIEAGCNDHISKPINKDQLLSLIQKHLKK